MAALSMIRGRQGSGDTLALENGGHGARLAILDDELLAEARRHLRDAPRKRAQSGLRLLPFKPIIGRGILKRTEAHLGGLIQSEESGTTKRAGS